MLLADLGQAGGGAFGHGDLGIGSEEDVAHGSDHGEGQRGEAAGPPGAAPAAGGFDEAAAAFPVGVGDTPAAAGEQEQPWAFDRVAKEHRVGAADLGAAGEDGELGCRGEDGGQFGEVPVAEAAFGFRAYEQHAAVGVEESQANEVSDDRFGGPVEGREAVPFVGPEPVADLVLLQAVGEQLLGDDVPWLRWGDDRFDPASSPQQQQAGGLDERVLREGQEQAVADGS